MIMAGLSFKVSNRLPLFLLITILQVVYQNQIVLIWVLWNTKKFTILTTA